MLKRIAMWVGVALPLVLLSTSGFGIADGWYVILSEESGKALTVDLAKIDENGANIKQWMYQGADHQIWKIESIGGGQYRITNKKSGRRLEVQKWAGGGMGLIINNNGTNVQQYQATTGDNQKWLITDVDGDGYYRLKNVNSMKSLELEAANHSNGANVWQYQDDQEMDQAWLLQPYVDCTWDGAEIQPLLINGDWRSKIDVVFIPDAAYSGRLADFQDDVWAAIRDGYLSLHEYCVDPIPVDYKSEFNFYWYWADWSGLFAEWYSQCNFFLPGWSDSVLWSLCKAAGSTSCGAKPAWFGSQAPWTDVPVVLAGPGAGCSKGFGLGLGCRLAAPGQNVVVIMHETGHSLFNLDDTYCGNTTTYLASPETNTWTSASDCFVDVATHGWNEPGASCRQIEADSDPSTPPNPECQQPIWRFDPSPPGAPDIMEVTRGNPPRFYEAATRGINWFYTLYWSLVKAIGELSEGDRSSPGVSSFFRLAGGEFTHVHSAVVDSFPNVGGPVGPFRLLAKSASGATVGDFQFSDPRVQFPPQDSDAPCMLDDVDFCLIFPRYEGMATISIVDSETGETLLDIDISDVLY